MPLVIAYVPMFILCTRLEHSRLFAQVIPLLVQVINAPDARANSNIDATENTISAFVKICRYVV